MIRCCRSVKHLLPQVTAVTMKIPAVLASYKSSIVGQGPLSTFSAGRGTQTQWPAFAVGDCCPRSIFCVGIRQLIR